MTTSALPCATPVRGSWLSWVVPGVAVPAALAGLALLAASDRLPAAAEEAWVLTALPLTALAGAGLLQRSPGHPLGRLLLLIGASSAAAVLSNGWAGYALSRADPLPAGALAAWVGSWVWALTAVPLLGLLPLLLPDGRLPSPAWRVVVGAAGLSATLLVVGNALAPGDLAGWPGVPNVVGLPPAAAAGLAAAGALGALLVPATGLASVTGLVVRWRRSDLAQRERLRLVALSAIPLALAVLWSSVAPSGAATAAVVLAMLCWAGCVVAAAAKHRLFDVDIAVSRTVVLVAVAAALLALHIVVVTLLDVGSLLATAVVAVLFAPLRDLVQRRVNIFLFGRRDDPWTSLGVVGRRVEAAGNARAALEDVEDVLAGTLRLASAQVLLADGGADVPVTTGRPASVLARERSLEQPLVHLGERVGVLRITPRTGEALGRRDRALLADLAPAVAVVAAAVLTAERLRRSQLQLLTAVEEERRRLRRDLHDGVGPALAGVAYVLEAARNVGPATGEVAELIDTATGELHEAVADLRRAVEGLRPPTLDDLGLVPALTERLAALSTRRCRLVLEVPAPLPPLAAAVEVAAYRIALEGAANVLRHADARHASVRLLHSGAALHVQVRDDGRGLPQPLRLGTGLLSVRERAAALGGRADVCAASPGTLLDVTLPVPAR